jgi:hypothetical protein
MRSLNETGNVNNSESSGDDFLWLEDLTQLVEAVVWDRDNTHVGFNGGERINVSRDLPPNESGEEC